jgi:glycosyltransferase involved in cell wall biosynthesis|tara:strand:- start:2797 stop:3858 length:1062 start_codon:yes stop_codon:yes gene_type:complete
MPRLKLAFVSGLSDKKLSQKLIPLQYMNEVDKIYLFRRRPYYGHKIYWVKMPYIFSKYAILGDICRFFSLLKNSPRFDIIIGCNQNYHGMIAFICGNIYKKPVVQIVVTEVEEIYKRWFLKKALLSASACLVRGPISYKKLKNLGYKGPVEVLHNCCSISKNEIKYNLNNKKYDLLAVGNYDYWKDYSLMMDVINEVRNKHLKLTVAIVGRGPFMKRLQSKLKFNNLSDHINFLGWKNDQELNNIYKSSRALLLTSKAEGLPMVVIEAMSHGLPVFVTSVGDLPWLINDGVEGRIIKYGKTNEMAKAIIEELLNENHLNEMGKNAYNRIISLIPEFSPIKVSMTWKKIMNSLV